MFRSQSEQIKSAKTRSKDVLSKISEAEKFWRQFRDMNGARLSDPSFLLPGNYNWLDALGVAHRALDAFQVVQPLPKTPIPTPTLGDLLQALAEIEEKIPQIVSFQDAITNESRPIRIISANAIAVDADGSVIVNVGPVATGLVGASDRLATATSILGSLCELGHITTSAPAEDVADYASLAVAALSQSETASAQIAKSRQEAETTAAEIANLLADAQSKLENATDLLSKTATASEAAAATASSVSTSTTANAATAAAKLEEITRLAAQAETAHAALLTYSVTLEEVKNKVSESESKAFNAVSEINNQQALVSNLITAAEKMVSGATVAGLAKAFADEKAYLEQTMQKTFFGFCIGILLLTVTSFGMAAYILHVPIEILHWKILEAAKSGEAGYEITVAGVLSRAIILLGPFWLTQFSARRYRSLFELRQQYSHKYNMAFSMDGFKNQSPENAQNIAAWVFSIVAANPVAQKPGGAMDEAPSTSISDMVNGAAGALGKVFGGKPG